MFEDKGYFGEHISYLVTQRPDGLFAAYANSPYFGKEFDSAPYNSREDALKALVDWAFEAYSLYIRKIRGDGMPVNTLTIREAIERIPGVEGVILNQLVTPSTIGDKSYDAIQATVILSRRDYFTNTLGVFVGDGISITDLVR